MNTNYKDFIDFAKIINNDFCLLITSSDFETSNLKLIIEPYKTGESVLEFIYKDNNYIFGKIENMYVLNVECSIGSTGINGSSLVTFEALEFKPKMTFLIGIAFGNKIHYKIGDILVSKDVYDYEKCAIKEDSNGIDEIRSMINQPYTQCNEKMYKLLPNSINDSYHIAKGTIISGEKICASETFLNKITLKVPTIWCGGDMEATGFVSACIRKKYNNWCIIKAISDYGDKNKTKNKAENQKKAIDNLLDYLKYIFKDTEKFRILVENDNNLIENSVINSLISNNKSDLNFSNNLNITIHSKIYLPKSIIIRNEMQEFAQIVSNSNWINVYGSALSGKTIFIKQFIVTQNSYYYLSMAKIFDIEEFLKTIINQIRNNTIKEHSIVVFDDFPKLYSYDPTLQLFVDFIEIIITKNIKIITIQNEKISENVLEYFNIKNFSNFQIENITEKEVYSFLKLFKISINTLAKREIEIILAISKRKIYLLNQLFQYFKAKNWDISTCIIDSLFQKNSRISSQDLQLLLLNKVADDQCRELLYRLSQAIEPISYDTLNKIANIKPSITNINEKLSKLINIWITETDDQKYYVNDNIKKITEFNIHRDTKKTINSILADEIINKKVLNQLDICNVIIHLCLSDRYNEAAEIYIIAMQELINTKAYSKDFIFVGIWKDISLPKQISFKLKLDIRIRQIVYFKQQNIELKTTLSLSKELFDNDKCPMLIKMGIPLLIYDIDFNLANKYVMECIKYVRNHDDNILDVDSPISKMCNIEQILLMIPLGIKNINDINIWLNNFCELSNKEVNNLFDNKLSVNGISPKELFNCTLELIKLKISSNKEFIILAELYLNIYKNIKAQKNEFLIVIFLRQFIQIMIGKLNVEIINVIDLEKEIDDLPNDMSKMLIILTLVEEYKRINSVEYNYWNQQYVLYIEKNKLNITENQ